MNWRKILLRAPDGGGGSDDGDKGGGDKQDNSVKGGDPGWYGQFNDESRAILRDAGMRESPNDLVKAFGTLRADAGKDRFTRPGADAKPEEIASWRRNIGVGDKPENYAWEDVDFGKSNPEFVKAVQGAAHKHGVPLDAAKGFFADVLGWTKGAREKDLANAANELQQEQSQLNATWGPEAAAKRALAFRAGAVMGLDEEAVHRLGGAVGYGKIMQGLAKVGDALREGRRLPGGDNLPNMDGDSFESASARLKEMKDNPDLRKRLMNGDKALLDERGRLSKIVAQGRS